MKRFYLLIAPLLLLLGGCKNEEKDIIRDIVYPKAQYAVINSAGENLFYTEPMSRYELEIIYNDVTYKYDGESRALIQRALALSTTQRYPYDLMFGDFDYNESGSYVIRFRGKEWIAEFDYRLEWVDNEPVRKSLLKIDGEELEEVVIYDGPPTIKVCPLYLD